MLRTLSKYIKSLILISWLSLIVAGFSYYLIHPEFFAPASLAVFLQRFGGFLLIVYFLLSALRGFTLIPSTPFVMAGLALFSDSLGFVYIISMAGILISATMIYFFAREMGFDQMILGKHTELTEKCRRWTKQYGFWAVMLWSFVIIVPTDLICYVAGTLRMRFWKYILAVAIGEGIICVILIFGGDAVINLVKSMF